MCATWAGMLRAHSPGDARPRTRPPRRRRSARAGRRRASRTCAGRRSRRGARRARGARGAGGCGRADRRPDGRACAAASARSCRGARRSRGRPPIGSQRNLPRRTAASMRAPVSERLEVAGCRDRDASAHASSSTSTAATRGAGDGGRESGADDLDLGKLGHVSGRLSIGPRLERGGHLGLLLARALAGRLARGRRPITVATKCLLWSGPLSVTVYDGGGAPRRAAISCRLVFGSIAAPNRAGSCMSGATRRSTSAVAASPPASRYTAPMIASTVSARIDGLSAPPVIVSPRPSRMYGPTPIARPTSASATLETRLARRLASSPSSRSGWSRNSLTVTACPRIESPRNSRRSLVGMPPFSYANDRCVSASRSRAGSISICSVRCSSSSDDVPQPRALRSRHDRSIGRLGPTRRRRPCGPCTRGRAGCPPSPRRPSRGAEGCR